MRTWSVFLLLLATSMAGCLDSLPEPPTTDEVEQTSPVTGLGPGNATLYLHAAGGDLWMDTTAGAGGDELSGTVTPASEAPLHRFPLRPAPERDVLRPGALDVRLDATTANVVGDGPVYEVALLVDGREVDRASSGGPGIVLDGGDAWPAGATVELEVCVCPAPASVTYGYRLATDGDSRVLLAFPDAGQSDGAPGGTSGGTGTTGSRTGDVTVTREGDHWRAQRTDTHQEATAATRADVSLSTAVGGVTVRHGAGSDLTVELSATGDTEQEARDRLEAMIVDYAATDGATFVLDAGVRVPDQDWNGRRAVLTLGLGPRELVALDVDTTSADVDVGAFTGGAWSLDSTTGEVQARGIDVDRLDVDTTTGRITLDGAIGSLTVDTSTGGLDLSGTVDDLTVESSTGTVDADVRATRSGSWSIGTSTGRVTLRVPEDASRGYDATADTTTGDIDFTFRDASPVGEQEDEHKHVRTDGYAARSIQTAIEVDTTTGDVRVGPS